MKWIATVTLLMAVAGVCSGRSRPSQDSAREFHSAVPLGVERIDLRPSGKPMYILATAESPMFEGWRSYDDGEHRFLTTSTGSKVKSYPRDLHFRVTATAMRPEMMVVDPYGTLHLDDGQINDYLLNLRFRLLIFHGLEITRVEPEALRLIGMPAQIRYRERIYQVEFTTPRAVPAADRIVLEVLSPKQSRLCKFHLDLF